MAGRWLSDIYQSCLWVEVDVL